MGLRPFGNVRDRARVDGLTQSDSGDERSG